MDSPKRRTERHVGLEPTSPAWKAGALPDELMPQFSFVALPAGLEPATSRVTAGRSASSELQENDPPRRGAGTPRGYCDRHGRPSRDCTGSNSVQRFVSTMDVQMRVDAPTGGIVARVGFEPTKAAAA